MNTLWCIFLCKTLGALVTREPGVVFTLDNTSPGDKFALLMNAKISASCLGSFLADPSKYLRGFMTEKNSKISKGVIQGNQ